MSLDRRTSRRFGSVEDLEEYLCHPWPEVVDSLRQLDGDLLILGAGGKMGPTLAGLARRAVAGAQLNRRVIAVSRFSDPEVADRLARHGVEVIRCDLLREDELDSLPEAPNVVYMVGTKFGSTGQEPRTWVVNAFLAGPVASRFRRSRIALFSSGNVYPLSPVRLGGCTERTSPAPVGEYAQSVLGRERIFQFFCRHWGTRGVILRLNYAVELRYGVLLDIARKIWAGEPIDLGMGHVNVIWQGDANAYALRSLLLVETPPCILNITGPETISVRALAARFGELLGRVPVLQGSEQPTALLSSAQLAHQLMGYPHVPLGTMIEWVAGWVMAGGPVLGKPTKFGVRDGRF